VAVTRDGARLFVACEGPTRSWSWTPGACARSRPSRSPAARAACWRPGTAAPSTSPSRTPARSRSCRVREPAPVRDRPRRGRQGRAPDGHGRGRERAPLRDRRPRRARCWRSTRPRAASSVGSGMSAPALGRRDRAGGQRIVTANGPSGDVSLSIPPRRSQRAFEGRREPLGRHYPRVRAACVCVSRCKIWSRVQI
jgi:hypothetical protein